MAAFEAAGDPERVPRRRRAVAAAEALLPPRLQPARSSGAARGDARPRPRVAVRRAARGVEARRAAGEADHHPGARAASTSASATRRCSRTRPRSTPTAWFAIPHAIQAAGLADRGLRARRPATSRPRCPRTTCSPGSGLADSGDLRHWRHVPAVPDGPAPCPTRCPSDNNVTAGWTAFAVFALLIVAVALLCCSFAKQLRKVKAANDAGVYDDHTEDGSDQLPPTHTG